MVTIDKTRKCQHCGVSQGYDHYRRPSHPDKWYRAWDIGWIESMKKMRKCETGELVLMHGLEILESGYCPVCQFLLNGGEPPALECWIPQGAPHPTLEIEIVTRQESGGQHLALDQPEIVTGRLCACGCGKAVIGNAKRRFSSDACKMRFHRRQ